jgi:hypothetical protein
LRLALISMAKTYSELQLAVKSFPWRSLGGRRVGRSPETRVGSLMAEVGKGRVKDKGAHK